MEILNKAYYKELWEKCESIPTLSTSFNDNASLISFKFIIELWRKKQPIHINFQQRRDSLLEISQHLFIELSNDIFCNAADFPPFNPGDKVRSKKKFSVGKSKALNLDFAVRILPNGKYYLFNEKHQFSFEKKFDELVQQFIPISKNAHNDTLTKSLSFFEKLNEKVVHDFAPAYFEKKFVFIAPKTIWDSLHDKSKIPSIYIPNPREESTLHEIKSIPAAPDCIMYFTPRYDVCYQKILQQGKKIDTIIICDTEEEKIQQILQDKNKFGFNIIFITNTLLPTKIIQIPCWNWFKEEVEIVNSL